MPLNMPIFEYKVYPDLPQYILHDAEKRPIDQTGKTINPHDPTQWMTYDVAQFTRTIAPNAAGIGFVLTADDPFFVVDIDKCREPVTGALNEIAQSWLDKLAGCGVEVSMSGTGIHIWGKCQPGIADEFKNRANGVEFYFSERYVALGTQMSGNINTDATAALRANLKPRPVATGVALPASGPVEGATPIKDDAALIEAACAVRGSAAAAFGDAARFADLWNVNAEVLAKHFPTDTDDAFDRSAADFALLSHLAFRTGKDQARMGRLWLASPLAQDRIKNAPTKQKRNKLNKHVKYVQESVTSAAQSCSSVYTGGSGNTVPPNDAQRRLIGLGTHHDMAVAFVDAHRGDVLQDSDRGIWMRWCGSHFEEVGAGEITQMVRLFCGQAGDRDAKTPRSLNFIRSVTELVSIDTDVARRTSIFDNDEFKLNTPDGTVDLRTGQMRQHARADYITKCTAVGPATTADGSRFVRFIDEVMCGDKEQIKYLQTMLGSVLSGARADHWFGFLHGVGRNGKSVLVDVLAHVMGDYATVAPSTIFMSTGTPDHREGIARLKGSRLVISSEVDSGAHFSDATLKGLTGDETITARQMRGSTFEFERSFKIIIVGNHLPQMRSVDQAMRSRIKLVRFGADFSDTADPDLPRVLRSVAGAILRWLIDGHKVWFSQNQRLGTTTAAEAEANDYFSNQLSVREWAEQELKWIADDCRAVTAWPSSQTLYDAYREWITQRGGHAVTMPRWADDMKSCGFINVKSGRVFWKHCTRIPNMPIAVALPGLPGVQLPGVPMPTLAIDNTKTGGRSDV